MSGELPNQKEQNNTVATVGMIFSIIWLIALISVIFAWFWLPLLFIWFILWIIGLFYKPRWKARVAICIPLIVFIAIFSLIAYIWSSVKTPATQFADWAKVEFENIDEETFDEDRFNAIINEEFNNVLSSLTEEDFKTMLETSTWSNSLEKVSYAFFGILQKGLENSLEKYNSKPLEIEEDNNEEINDESEEFEIISDEVDENEENNNDNTDQKTNGTFSKSEQNDIDKILSILE